ncbi:MAG: hypothetical protein GXY32_00250 [Ruminococcaceae bacterium]|nr:hypothetical protein [Oscillospiraceae bacterium]
MIKKRVGNLLSALAVSLALVMSTAALPPLSAMAAVPADNAGSIQWSDASGDPSSGSNAGGGSSEPDVEPIGGLEIVSYEITQGAGNVPSTITKDMTFSLFIRIRDNRDGVSSSYNPEAKLNTSSFTTNSNIYPQVTKHKTSSGAYFTLDFQLTYTGVGNTVQFDLFYHNNASVPVQSLSLTLNQCVESTDDSSDSSSEPSRSTGFVLKSVNFGGPNVTAGNVFNLDAELMSTNGTYGVENVSVNLVLPKEISLSTGQSISYVGRVGPNQTVPVAFELLPSAVAEEGSYTLTISVAGVNAEDGSAVTADMDVTIPLVQPERFEISNVTAPDYLTAGVDDGSGFTSVTLVNKGKETINNVTVYVEGEGLSTDMGRQYVGNIASGSQNSADFSIIASTPGQIDAKIVVEYENSRGELKTLDYPFTITVEDFSGGDDGMIDPYPIDPVPEEPEGMPVWGWVLIIVGVIVVVVIVLVVILKKRKARKAAADLEDDNDEDF